jgi:adenylate kinase family enzyme
LNKILVFGNSGSGKSTLASKLSTSYELSHLDLDTIAWKPVNPPERMPISESSKLINHFISCNGRWVIEGCYSDLLELVMPYADELIFLNLPIADCIANAIKRPWEPHKYVSKAAQDANLDMLIDWIKQYNSRTDTFSRNAHEKIFAQFQGTKRMYIKNECWL